MGRRRGAVWRPTEVKTAGPTGSAQEMAVLVMALGGLVVLLGMITIPFVFLFNRTYS